jgi:quinol monooxygenase YgiN
MYGTVARLRVKPGKMEELRQHSEEEGRVIPGILFQYVYKMDADPDECYLVVGFESKEAYRKNAESPEQHERYLKYRALLDAEPEWHDGEVVFSVVGANATV